MDYRRLYKEGGTYFFTVVTHQRRPFLTLPEHVELLRTALREVMKNYPFVIVAFVLLADHLHCLWTLPPGDSDYSTRWRLVKSHFTRECLPIAHGEISPSRAMKGEKAVWQRRSWEHTIRDQDDFSRHFDYIHYNPVKHGYVSAPKDWPYSSFHKYVREGTYDVNWGANIEMHFDNSIGAE